METETLVMGVFWHLILCLFWLVTGMFGFKSVGFVYDAACFICAFHHLARLMDKINEI